MISAAKFSRDILLQAVHQAARPVILCARIALTCLITSTSIYATIDSNENGVSDLWEIQYNDGNLFTTFDPTADPDKDGWTNAMEAAAGTNPSKANPPDGYIQPSLEHYPAVYITGENGPETLTPEAYLLTWPTLIGKQYTLLFSPDLASGSWLPIGSPVTAIGTGAVAGIPITQPDGSVPPAIFWRVSVSDTDADDDGLNDHEEFQLNTNPFLTDSDGDGTPDATDTDTYLNHPELAPPGSTSGGTGGSAVEPPPEPVFLNCSEKLYMETCTTFEGNEGEDPSYIANDQRRTATTNGVVSDDSHYYETDLGTNSAKMTAGLAAMEYAPFPTVAPGQMEMAIFRAKQGEGPAGLLNFHISTDSTSSSAFGHAISSRFRLERSTADPYPRTMTYLKLHQTGSYFKLSKIDSVKLVIPPNETISNEEELKTEANKTFLRLARFAVEDNTPATGVDNVSNTVENLPNSGYQEFPWIMAPCGGSVTIEGEPFSMTNDCSIIIGNSIPSSMEITCPSAKADAAVFPTVDWSQPNKTSFRGEGNVTGDQTPAFKFGTGADQFVAELPVRVKVMKKRELKVRVHYVTGARKNAAGEFTDLQPPLTMPSKAAIINKLHVVYGAQVNSWFNNLEVIPETTDWDSGNTANWGSAAHPIAPTGESISSYNKILDLGGNIDDFNLENSNVPNAILDFIDAVIGHEEKKLWDLNEPGTEAAHIDVFILGGCEGIRTSSGLRGVFTIAGSPTLGETRRKKRVCFIAGGTLLYGALLPENRLLQVIAHELGHVIVGKGHPDKEGDPNTTRPAPLSGTRRLNRLMYSDLTSKAHAKKLDTNLLVKAEWDSAETWFTDNVDNPPPP